jgi:uncharacterized membrane protein YciS (DUF1049 family)
MKHVKVLFFLLFCGTIAIGAVQNAETLSPVLPMVVHWPGLLSTEFGLPIFVLISILFAAGVVLTSLSYLGEHFRLRRSVAEAKQSVADLERELLPEPEPDPGPDPGPEPGPDAESQTESQVEFKAESESMPETSEPKEQWEDSSPAWRRGAVAAEISSTETSTLTFQNPTESTMEKKHTSESNVLAENTEQAETDNTTASSPEVQEGTPESTEHVQSVDASGPSKTVLESISESLDNQSSDSSQSGDAFESRSKFKEDEVLERPSGPGWGAVLLLSAALALVVSSGVYIVLNSQVTKMADQLSDLHIQSGHMASAQEEMGRIWELERVSVRDELDSLGQGQKQLGIGIESLEEQMSALQALPEIMRKQLVAGFLRDTAGKTAFLGSQVETEEQRETLERVEEMLQSLAKELENAEEGQ